MRQKVNDVLMPGNMGTWQDVRGRLNSILHGWSNYFCYGTLAPAYQAVDHHVADRVRYFLKRRSRMTTRGTRKLPDRNIFGPLGVVRLWESRNARP
jgi:RNA-directed DNA polymerase